MSQPYQACRVEQHGGAFRVYRDGAPEPDLMAAPMEVPDGDLELMDQAREWFERKCKAARIIPIFD